MTKPVTSTTASTKPSLLNKVTDRKMVVSAGKGFSVRTGIQAGFSLRRLVSLR